jgi:hypothetical protein
MNLIFLPIPNRWIFIDKIFNDNSSIVAANLLAEILPLAQLFSTSLTDQRT